MESARLELWWSFLRFLLSSAATVSLSSPPFSCLVRVLLHLKRLDARSFQCCVLISRALISLLKTSLKRSCGRPTPLLPIFSPLNFPFHQRLTWHGYFLFRQQPCVSILFQSTAGNLQRGIINIFLSANLS